MSNIAVLFPSLPCVFCSPSLAALPLPPSPSQPLYLCVAPALSAILRPPPKPLLALYCGFAILLKRDLV